MKRLVCAVVLSVIGLPAFASAQERGQVGVTMGYPAAIGLQWQITDRFAIRPDISFNFSHVETESDFFDATSESSGKNVIFGLSGIWYTRPEGENLRPYLTPRVAWIHTSSDDDDDDPGLSDSSWAASGSFGLQYSPTARFAIFGEAGIGYTRSERGIDTVLGNVSTASTSWTTRTAVGVIFYFGG